jgi:hypothetical protein
MGRPPAHAGIIVQGKSYYLTKTPSTYDQAKAACVVQGRVGGSQSHQLGQRHALAAHARSHNLPASVSGALVRW